MKYITLILISFLSIISVGQTNNLVVYTEEASPFYLVIDEIKQNEKPASNIRITDLEGDFHKVSVVFEDKNIEELHQSVSFLNTGTEIKMVVKKEEKGEYNIKYADETTLNKVEKVDNQVQINFSKGGEVEENSALMEKETTTSSSEDENSKTVSKSTVPKSELDNKKENTVISAGGELIEGGDEIEGLTFAKNGTMCSSSSVSKNEYMEFRYEIEETSMFNREEFILSFFKENCMTSAQVAGIVNLNYSTVNAYEIAKSGYRYTWDTENYNLVISTLKPDSEREKLISFLDIGDESSGVEESSIVNGSNSKKVIKDKSRVSGYSGNVGCINGDIVDVDEINEEIKSLSKASEKMNAIRQASQGKCLTVDGVKKLSSTFTQESDRVDFAEWAFHHTYDMDNYYQIINIFVHSGNKQKLGDYISENISLAEGLVFAKESPTVVPGYGGQIGSYEIIVDGQLLKNVVSEQVFKKDKMLVINLALQNRAITVDQFMMIANEFTSEKDILDFARLAYPKTYNQDDFHKVKDLLSFNSSKKDLDALIEGFSN